MSPPRPSATPSRCASCPSRRMRPPPDTSRRAFGSIRIEPLASTLASALPRRCSWVRKVIAPPSMCAAPVWPSSNASPSLTQAPRASSRACAPSTMSLRSCGRSAICRDCVSRPIVPDTASRRPSTCNWRPFKAMLPPSSTFRRASAPTSMRPQPSLRVIEEKPAASSRSLDSTVVRRPNASLAPAASSAKRELMSKPSGASATGAACSRQRVNSKPSPVAILSAPPRASSPFLTW